MELADVKPVEVRNRPIPYGWTRYRFDDFEILHFTTGHNGYWRFDMDETCVSSVGAFYRGPLRIVEAKNPELIGTVFHGFWDFTAPENLPYNTKDSWMNCVADGTFDWFCVHSEGAIKRISMGPTFGCPEDMVYVGINPLNGFYLGR
jgi:hypothetical protein